MNSNKYLIALVGAMSLLGLSGCDRMTTKTKSDCEREKAACKRDVEKCMEDCKVARQNCTKDSATCAKEEAECKAECREKSQQCDVEAADCNKGVEKPNNNTQPVQPGDSTSAIENSSDETFKSSLSNSYRMQYDNFTPAQKMQAMQYAKENNVTPDTAVAKVASDMQK